MGFVELHGREGVSLLLWIGVAIRRSVAKREARRGQAKMWCSSVTRRRNYSVFFPCNVASRLFCVGKVQGDIRSVRPS